MLLGAWLLPSEHTTFLTKHSEMEYVEIQKNIVVQAVYPDAHHWILELRWLRHQIGWMVL